MRMSHEQIAESLLAEGFYLTALELYAELAECGRSLPLLHQFFSASSSQLGAGGGDEVASPSYRRDTPIRSLAPSAASFPNDISRSGSQMTLDSIDQLTRYSEDTDRKEEDRLAVLEYELRTSREMISQLRNTIAHFSAEERQRTVSEGGLHHAGQEGGAQDEEEIPLRPHEQKQINYLVNDYLVRSGYKLTAITFSDECGGEDFDEWEEVSPPTLLNIFRGGGGCARTAASEAAAQTEEALVEEVLLTQLQQRLVEAEIREHTQLDRLEAEKQELVARLEDSQVELARLAGLLELTRQELEEKVKPANKAQETISGGGLPLEREEGDGASVAEDGGSSPATEQEYRTLAELAEYSQSLSPRPVSARFQLSLHQAAFPLDTAISYALGECIVDTLASTLPRLVSSLVLAMRGELVPLLLYTISRHKNSKTRDELIGLLFNLTKRPDAEARRRILAGFGWLCCQPGWSGLRVEEEILPHLWSQLEHKLVERRILVCEAAGVLTPHLQPELRSSLLLAMLDQLARSSEPSVVSSAVRSLALVANLVEEGERLARVRDLLLQLLPRHIDEGEVRGALESCLLPVLAVWLREQDAGLYYDFLQRMLEAARDTIRTSSQHKAGEQCAGLVGLFSRQLPHLAICLAESCPQQQQQLTDTCRPESVPDDLSMLGDSVVGSLECLWASTDQPQFPIWTDCNTIKQLLLLLIDIVSQSPSCLRAVQQLAGRLRQLVGPQLSQLLLGQPVLHQLADDRCGQAWHLLYPMGLIGAATEGWAGRPEDLVVQGLHRAARDETAGITVETAFRLMCEQGHYSTAVQLLVAASSEPVPEVGSESIKQLAGLITRLGPHQMEEAALLASLAIPALRLAAQDRSPAVRKSAAGALAAVLSSPHIPFQEKEEVYEEMDLLTQDEDEDVCVETLQHLGIILPLCQDVREKIILPLLCGGRRMLMSGEARKEKRALSALITSLSYVPQLSIPDELLSRLVIPFLEQLLTAVESGQPELAALQEPLLLLISQVEGRRRPSWAESKLSRQLPASTENHQKLSFDGSEGEKERPAEKGNVKEKVQKLFQKPATGNPFWKK